MKINTCPNNLYNRSYNQNKIGFKMQKTYLITDFDGTLKPDNMDSVYQQFRYFLSISRFQNDLRSKLKIIITTGRNKSSCTTIENEMDYVNEGNDIINRIEYNRKKIPIHFPQPSHYSDFVRRFYYPNVSSIITENGEKKYNIIDNKLVYSQRYEEKKNKFLQERYQIELKEIEDIIKGVIKNEPFFSNEIQYSKHFPSTLSIKCLNDDPYYYKYIAGQLNKELTKKNKPFEIFHNRKNNSILIKLKRNGQIIAKDCYVAMKLEKAKKNNDLIIVAGNDVNDIEMLNIFSYVNLPDNCTIPQNPQEAKNLLRLYPEIKEEIEQLPLHIIVVGNTLEYTKYASLLYFFKVHFYKQYTFALDTITTNFNHYLNAIKNARNSYFQKLDYRH